MFISKKQIQISRNLLDAHVSRRHGARKYWNSNRSQSVSIGPPPTNALLVITLNSTTKLTAHCWKDCKCSQRKVMCIVMHWMTGELDSDLACKQKGPIWRNVILIFQDEMYCILHRSYLMTRFLSLFSKYFVKYLKYFDKCRPPNGKEIRGLFAAIVHVQKGREGASSLVCYHGWY